MFQKVSGIEKQLCPRGEYHDFLQKNCCLTVPKNFMGQPILVSLNLDTENFLLEKVLSQFSVEFVVSKYRKTS